MAFNVDEFLSTISDKSGPMSASRFQVSIFPRQQSLVNNSIPLSEQKLIQFSAFSATIPGVVLDPDFVFLRGYGRINEVPVRNTMGNCDLQFYLDSDNTIYKFLHNWINSVINNDGGFSAGGQRGNAYYQEVYYPENYLCDISITVFSYDAEQIMTVNLKECYPSELSGINLSWAATDTITTASASIIFHHMEIVDGNGTNIIPR